MKRAPWYADALALAAEPRAPYTSWRGHALLFAGSTAWNDARATRDRGARAVTVLPPGEAPGSLVWPPVGRWIVSAGDLPAGDALELGRRLIDCGGQHVQIVGDRLAEPITFERETQ